MCPRECQTGIEANRNRVQEWLLETSCNTEASSIAASISWESSATVWLLVLVTPLVVRLSQLGAPGVEPILQHYTVTLH